MTTSTLRETARRQFVESILGDQGIGMAPASADASFRSYWRVATEKPSAGATTWILMDAPADKEDLGPWLDIDKRLRNAGLHAPEILAVDLERGFVLMEDLGDRTYLPELEGGHVDALYADALDALLRMQTSVDVSGLPEYDQQRLLNEMRLMPQWFLERHLGFALDSASLGVIETAFNFLADEAVEQPRAFVHRDFHSRNLLVVESAEGNDESHGLPSPAIIDFQDAVIGPITYDLVSLLRDCYIEWEKERVAGWVEAYRQRLSAAHLLGSDVSPAQFSRWFDLIGLQRHIKVLGIFCRLWYRDGKRQYLDDLPLVWRYAITVAQRYPELSGFAQLLENALGKRDIRASRDPASA